MQRTSPTDEIQGTAGGLVQVRRLATELAARMRYAQIVARPLPPGQVQALVAAARLLQEHGEPWPAIVGEVLRQVADDLSPDDPAASAPEAEGSRIVAGLTRFLGAFRRDPPSPRES